MLTRRRLLATAAATTAATALPRMALSEITLGAATLTTASDGHLVLPPSMSMGDLPPAEVATVLAKVGLTPGEMRPECNLALYRDGTNTVIFDVGSGPDFMPTAGTIVDSLDAMGIDVADITHAVFTHAHPDHLWGLLDEFDEPLFPEATYMMGRAEWDYWWNPATVDSIGAARAAFAVGARRRMEVIEDSVVLFDDGQEILPGIAAFATHGHTPGHMSFEVGSGSETAIVVGDAVTNHHLNFLRPDWASGSDQDPERGIETRVALLDRLATTQTRFVGFHLPMGGIGRVERADGAYRFVAEGV